MTIETIGNWQWEVEESENASFFNVTVKNLSENKTVKVNDVVWVTGREDFLKDLYNSAVETLQGVDSCCFKGKTSWVV
jgi:hypothetical protein